MPKRLTVAVSQSHTLLTTSATLTALASTVREASLQGVHLLLFPEAYLGGYPRTCNFGAAVGSRSDAGREQFLQYFHNAIDLGDTPRGAGDDWVERRLEVAKGQKYRGDGTREELEKVARGTGVFLVVGLVERAGGSLYCSERLIWAQGPPSTLRAVTTTIADVKLTLAAAICWENYMPLLRYSLYSQNVNLYLAPTADARDTWLPLMRTIACESRASKKSASKKNTPTALGEKLEVDYSVLEKKEAHNLKIPSSDQSPMPKTPEPTPVDKAHGVISPSPLHIGTSPSDRPNASPEKQRNGRRRSSNLMPMPDNHFLALPGGPVENDALDEHDTETTSSADDDDDEFVSRGGSCIIGATGEVLEGPLWEVEDGGLLIARDIDFEDCERGRLDLDVAGSYSRNDAFELRVAGLNIDPPP
ncbi:MAG: hypothetical protein Q9186_006542 [Xanthomendoza sp. 1 TL-2023]